MTPRVDLKNLFSPLHMGEVINQEISRVYITGGSFIPFILLPPLPLLSHPIPIWDVPHEDVSTLSAGHGNDPHLRNLRRIPRMTETTGKPLK